RHRVDLLSWVAGHGWAAPIVFMVTYAVTVMLSLPVIGVLTVVGGFFFGIVPGALWSVIGATVGAAPLHAATYPALGSWVARRAAPDLTIVFEPQILLPMLAMGLLSLAPVGYRRLMARKG